MTMIEAFGHLCQMGLLMQIWRTVEKIRKEVEDHHDMLDGYDTFNDG